MPRQPKLSVRTRILHLFRPENRWLLIGAGLSLIALLLVAFPFRFVLVPALVNGQPIFSWNYLLKLHQRAGSQVLDQMINELLIKQEVAKQGIQVDPSKVDQEINRLADQIGSTSGGLDAFLNLQGMTRQQLAEQIRLELALEKVVTGTIVITDEEIAQELNDNPDRYKGLSDLDSATTAAQNLRTGKLNQAFTDWFEQIKSQAKISQFLLN